MFLLELLLVYYTANRYAGQENAHRSEHFLFRKVNVDYLLAMYMVTSKPKRISVYSGFVHIVILL